MTNAIRIGDAEREAAISSLASHFAEGRLTQVEHEERMALALNAKTGRDLDVLFADLPRRGDATPATRRPPRGLRIERLMQPLFVAAVLVIGIFVILNLLPFIALVVLAIVASRLLFGMRYRRHGWYRSQGWYGGTQRRW
jgi:Flp pilus assembly protein TadB